MFSLITQGTCVLFSPHFLITWTSYCAAAPSPPILSLCSMFRGVSAAEVLHEVDFSNPVCEKEIMSEFPSESVRLPPPLLCSLWSVIFYIPGFFAANKRPLIHPDSLLTLPLLLFPFFPQHALRHTNSPPLCSQRPGRRIEVSRDATCSFFFLFFFPAGAAVTVRHSPCRGRSFVPSLSEGRRANGRCTKMWEHLLFRSNPLSQ